MRLASLVVALSLLCFAQSKRNPLCDPELCANALLNDPNGPQLMKLATELAKKDANDVPKTPYKCNGRTFALSEGKKRAANHAVQHGLPEPMLEVLLEQSLPSESPSREQNPRAPKNEGTPPPETSEDQSEPTEEEPSDQPSSEGSSARNNLLPECKIVTNKLGDMLLQLGDNAQLPMNEMHRLEGVLDPQMLNRLTTTLRSVGVPVTKRGNQIKFTQQPPTGDLLSMNVLAVDGTPVKSEVQMNDRHFELPGQQRELNQHLAKNPQMGFPLMKLFAENGIRAQLDCNRKSITTELPKSKDDQFTEPTSSSLSPEKSYPKDDEPPKTSKLPNEWKSIKDAVESNKVSAAKIQRLIEDQNLSVPKEMEELIFNKIMEMKDEVMSVQRDQDCIVYMDGSPLSLLNQPTDIAELMNRLNIPTEMIRNSLMMIGVKSEITSENSMKLTLPSQQHCVLNNVEFMDVFKYEVVNDDDNSINVSAGQRRFKLPAAVSKLKSAMDRGSVLPLELMKSLNSNGIHCKVDADNGIMSMKLPKQTLRIPLETQTNKSKKLRLVPLEGPLGTSYILEFDGGRLHLPSQVDQLNELIRHKKINSHDVLFLFLQNTLIPYKFDKQQHAHVLQVAGQTITIMSSGIE